MSLLAAVLARLRERDMPHALIGASAMAHHGVSRATLDVDLLTVGRECLQPSTWRNLGLAGVEIDPRRGDADDPLAGVVRFRASGERPVDLIVAKRAWQRRAIERAAPTSFEGEQVPVVQAADLVLLKLYAGGPQDAWDVHQLLDAAEDPNRLRLAIEAGLDDLPRESRDLWVRIHTSPSG
jgi:hypothetical protein